MGELTNLVFFWYFVVPVTSAIIVMLYKLLAKQNHEEVVTLDFFVGPDLLVGAFTSNLAFAVSRLSQIPNRATSGFLIITISLLIILGLNSVFLRFCAWPDWARIGISDVIGIFTLGLSFMVWVVFI